MTRLIAAAVFAVFTPISAMSAEGAKPSLRDVAAIENPLFAVAVAREVAEKCDNIAARTFKGLRLLYSLRSTANGMGYSDREIRAYIDNDQEKARMRAKGERLLRQNGVNLDDPETFCAYGRAEIQKNSAIGVLLRAK